MCIIIVGMILYTCMYNPTQGLVFETYRDYSSVLSMVDTCKYTATRMAQGSLREFDTDY